MSVFNMHSWEFHDAYMCIVCHHACGIILICVPKMNWVLKVFEQHDGESFMTELTFWVSNPFNVDDRIILYMHVLTNAIACFFFIVFWSRNSVHFQKMCNSASYRITVKTHKAAVASGAGPRAVGTERGRWSKW